MINNLEEMWKQAVMTCFEILSWFLSRKTE